MSSRFLFNSLDVPAAIPMPSSMGASLADILPEFRALWIQTGVYFLATCLVFRQQLRSARLKANLTAEVAEEEDEAEEIVENS